MPKNKKVLYAKIIGGKFKGKRLLLPAKQVTRSSKARLKESLFDTLQFDILDQNFIEMFGGSGSIGLEALSRGAKRAFFIESDLNSYNTLQKNCRAISPDKCETYHDDAFVKLPQLIDRLHKTDEKSYLYIDPPFSIREGKSDIYEKTIASIGKIPPESIIEIIVEHMSLFSFPTQINDFKKIKEKKFGKSTLSYYKSS